MVFPCFDQPDLKARYRLTVTVPPEWTAWSNGSGAQVSPGRWEFTETPPSPKPWMDAYLAAFALAGSCRMVTTDRDFRQFADLDLVLLGSPMNEGSE